MMIDKVNCIPQETPVLTGDHVRLIKKYQSETRIGKEILNIIANNKDEERYRNDSEYRKFANDVINWWVSAHFKYQV